MSCRVGSFAHKHSSLRNKRCVFIPDLLSRHGCTYKYLAQVVMADTPPTMVSSWVDLTSEVGRSTPPISTGHWCTLRSGPPPPPHPLGSSDYLRLLREAQSVGSSVRTSPLTSALATRCSTCRNSGTVSPKSPPNSPNVELSDGDAVEVFYVNRVEGLGREVIEDFLWDWSSLPTSTPPKWTRARSEAKPKEEEKVR